MFKKFLLASALISSLISCEESKKQMSFFERMESISQEMRNLFNEEFNRFTSGFKNSSNSPKPDIDFSSDAQYLTISIKVNNIDDKKIKINAKKNNLNGEFSTTDHGHVKFEVTNGNAFSINARLKNEEESNKKENFNQIVIQGFSNYTTLPEKVTNLESAEVELRDNNTLILKLPRTDAAWKKIEVK